MKENIFNLFKNKLNHLENKEHPFYLNERKPIIEKNERNRITLRKRRKFLNECLTGKNHIEYDNIENPIVSAIIPVFNCNSTIRAALLSIQNQNLTNIEIILINDYSSDNNKDYRFIFVNN